MIPRFLAVAAVYLASDVQAVAQATWSTNPANGQLSNGVNWAGGTAPADASAWVFTNSSTTTLTNGFSDYTVDGIRFTTNASAYSFGGNAFTLTGGITNNSTAHQIISNNLTINSAVNLSNAGNLTGELLSLRGALSGSGTITYGAVANQGRLTFSGGSHAGFSGAFIANSGRVNIGAPQSSASADYTFDNGGGTFLTFSNSTYNFGSLSGNGNIANNTAARTNTLSIGANGTSTTFSGNLSTNNNSTINLLKVGAGTLTLSGANTYSGTTTISNGVLQIGAGGTSGSIANTASIAIDGGSLAINRSDNIAQGTDFTAAALTGSGGFMQMGAGTTTLTADNTYAGATVVSAGALRIGNGGTTGSLSASSTITNNGTLVFDRSDNLAQGTDFSTAAISGAGTFVKRGAGTLTLNAANDYSGGTSLEEGTIIYTVSDAIGSGTLTMADGTVLSGSGGTRTINNNIVVNGDVTFNDQAAGGSFNGNIDLTGGTRQLNIASSSTFNGVISNGSVVMDSTASFRSMTLTAANTFDDITVLRGILRLSGSGSLSADAAVDLAPTIATSTLDIAPVDASTSSVTIGSLSGTSVNALVTLGSKQLIVGGNNASTTFAGIISDTNNGSVTKTGSGTLTLSGTNTYTGATTVSGGELTVNGSIADSAVTVQSGAVLSGSGTVGATTINSGATIAPGNSPGTLTITNGLTWAGGGNYNWQIFGLSGTAGQTNTWDLIDVTAGTWDITGLSSTNKFNINLWSLSGLPDTTGSVAGFNAATNYSWKILSSVGITGTFNTNSFNINTGAVNGTGGFVGASGLFSLALDENNDLFLNYTGSGQPIPEPGTWAAGALLALAAGLAARRRRRNAALACDPRPSTAISQTSSPDLGPGGVS